MIQIIIYLDWIIDTSILYFFTFDSAVEMLNCNYDRNRA